MWWCDLHINLSYYHINLKCEWGKCCLKTAKLTHSIFFFFLHIWTHMAYLHIQSTVTPCCCGVEDTDKSTKHMEASKSSHSSAYQKMFITMKPSFPFQKLIHWATFTLTDPHILKSFWVYKYFDPLCPMRHVFVLVKVVAWMLLTPLDTAGTSNTS